MKILAWDTSQKSGSIAALNADGASAPVVIFHSMMDTEAAHSEQLLFSIDEILKRCGWTIQDVDLFGVGVGPGSFTGLRIGITTARTLAHSLKKPLVGVSSLASLAKVHAGSPNEDKFFVSIANAFRGEVFAFGSSATDLDQCISFGGETVPALWSDGAFEEAILPEDLVQRVNKICLEKGLSPVVCGSWDLRMQHHFASWATSDLTSKALSPAVMVGRGAYEILMRELAPRNPLDVFPRYIRPSHAEIKLAAGELPPGPSRF